jgi:hypothetical protein
MLTKSNEQALGIVCQSSSTSVSIILHRLEHHALYSYIVYFLKNLTFPRHLVNHKRKALRLKASKYCIIQDGLGWRNPEGLILRCIDEVESKKLITKFHVRFCGGHYAAKTTTHKIIRVGYC